MHRLGDVVDVRLVEAAPVAGALRFELLSEGQAFRAAEDATAGRRHRKRRSIEKGASGPQPAQERSQAQGKRKKSGKAKKGKSWKR